MDPSLLLAAGNQVTGQLTDLMNFAGTQVTNAQNRKFSREMYQLQRKDALEFWGMQNAYNAPAAQMQRYRDAGLNPNLIYGQSNLGGNVQVPDVTPVNFREPKFQGSKMDSLMFADLRIKNAQANNLETQTQVIREDAILRKFQALSTEQNYNLEKDLYSVNADARRAGLRKTQVETDVLLDRNAREAVLNATNVAEAAERMLNLSEQRKNYAQDRFKSTVDVLRTREEIANLNRAGVLQQMDIELRKLGVNPNDPMWSRIVGRFLQDIGEGKVTARNIGSSVWSFITGN